MRQGIHGNCIFMSSHNSDAMGCDKSVNFEALENETKKILPAGHHSIPRLGTTCDAYLFLAVLGCRLQVGPRLHEWPAKILLCCQVQDGAIIFLHPSSSLTYLRNFGEISSPRKQKNNVHLSSSTKATNK
jgi:hypothetical protein